MARRPFGGDFSVVDALGNQLVGSTGFAYDAESGGTLLVDLTDQLGTPLAGGQLTTIGGGKCEWLGTDDLRDNMWVDFGYGRFKVFATDLSGRVSLLETSNASLLASVASLSAILATGGPGTTPASLITYDPSTSGLDPLSEFDMQGVADELNHKLTQYQEFGILKSYELTVDLITVLAGSATTPEAPGLRRTDETVTTSNSGTAVTLPDAYCNGFQVLTLNGAAPVITLPPAVVGQQFVLWVIQDATGSRVPSWVVPGAGSVKWPSGAAIAPTATANAVDLYQFYCRAAGQWSAFRDAADIR